MNNLRLWRFGIFALVLLFFVALAKPGRALDVTVINDVPAGHPCLKYTLQLEADVAKASGDRIRILTNRSIPGNAGLNDTEKAGGVGISRKPGDQTNTLLLTPGSGTRTIVKHVLQECLFSID